MSSTKALAGGNTFLTGMSKAMVPGDVYIAERVLPVVNVDYDEFDYVDFDDDTFMGATASGSSSRGDRMGDGTFERRSIDMSNASDRCQEKGFESLIDRRKAKESRKKAVDLMQAGQIQTRTDLLITREVQAAAALFNATTFTASTAALTGGNRWDVDTSNPVSNKNTAKQYIEKSATAMGGDVIFGVLVGAEVHDALMNNPVVSEKVKYTAGLRQGEVPEFTDMANFFSLEEYVVGKATYNSAVQNADGSITGAYIWGKSVLFYARARAPQKLSPALGYTFTSMPFTVDTYYSPDSDGDVVRTRDSKIHKIINVSAGYYYTTVTS